MRREFLWIALILAAVAVFFLADHFLVDPSPRFPHREVTAWTDPNPDAFLQYRKRFSQWTIPDTFRAARDTRLLFGLLKSGKISQAEYDIEANRIIERLCDLNCEVTGRSVPIVFHKPAICLSRSHGDFYRCLVKLKEYSRTKHKKALLDNAWQDWLNGYKNTTIAKNGIRMDIGYRR